MAKICRVAGYQVDAKNQAEFEKIMEAEERYEGEILSIVVKVAETIFYCISIWENNEAITAAEEEIGNLRKKLGQVTNAISPASNIKNLVSGEILLLDGIDWRSGALTAYASDEFDEANYNEPPEWEE